MVFNRSPRSFRYARLSSKFAVRRSALVPIVVMALVALSAGVMAGGGLASAMDPALGPPPGSQGQVFFFDPGPATWTVPDGVCRVSITVVGGMGGWATAAGFKWDLTGSYGRALGGFGAGVTMNEYPVKPGDTLQMYVGEGGANYLAPFDWDAQMYGIAAGGGGGASSVNIDDPALRIIAGGGGGGAWYFNDGAAPSGMAIVKSTGGSGGAGTDGAGGDASSTSPYVTPAKGGAGGVGGAGGTSTVTGLVDGGKGADGLGGSGGKGSVGYAPMTPVVLDGGAGTGVSPAGLGGDGTSKIVTTGTPGAATTGTTGGGGGGGGGGYGGGGGGGSVGGGAAGGSVAPAGAYIGIGTNSQTETVGARSNGRIDIFWTKICGGGGGGGGGGGTGPTVTPPSPQTANGTTPVVYDVPPTVTPGPAPINNGATCIVDPATGACGTVVTLPGEGTWVLDLATGALTFTALPTATPGATESVVLRVTDQNGNVGEGTFSVLIPDGSVRPNYAG